VLLLNNQRIWATHRRALATTAELPTMLGSENRLRILFKQLIDNAVKPSRVGWRGTAA
jgi:signal transduction histidine kinase